MTPNMNKILQKSPWSLTDLALQIAHLHTYSIYKTVQLTSRITEDQE